MALPILTPEQRQAALEKAAQARQLRAEVKNRLKNSGATLAEVIQEVQGQRDHRQAEGQGPPAVACRASARCARRRSWTASASPTAVGCGVWAPTRSRRS